MSNRPNRPGAAWSWDRGKQKWVRPAKPGPGFTWDDDAGWKAPQGTGGAGGYGDPGSSNSQANIPAQPEAPTPATTAAPAPTKTGTTTEEIGDATNGYFTVYYDVYSDGSRVETKREINAKRRDVMSVINQTITSASWGGVNLGPLAAVVDSWIKNGFADASNGDEIIMNMLWTSTDVIPNSNGLTVSGLMNQRFPGYMAANQNGQNMTLSEYRELEQGYIDRFKAYNLPPEMFDNPADFGSLIAGNVSVNEVEARIVTAQTALNSSDPSVVDAFQRYYGVGRNDLLAYMLDGEKGQGIIESRARAATVGGAASRYGFNLTADQASGYGNQSSLSGYNAVQVGSQLTNQSERLFSSAADLRDTDIRLSAIDKEEYSANDAIDVAFGDREKGLKSKKRAERETARFAGSSGITASSLNRRAI